MDHESCNLLPPYFSIIIPTFNRPDRLKFCLESLLDLKYRPDRFEVIVVDDGSEFPPEKAIETVRDRLNITLLSQNNSGPAAARNAGAARSRGSFLVFIDDDCFPATEWLSALASSFARSPKNAVGGSVLNALKDNRYSITSQAIIDLVYDHYNEGGVRPRFFATNNLAVPAEGFRAVGGFDPDFITAEDREFCDRWLQNSFNFSYAPEAIVYHANDLTLRGFCRQHFNYGRGAFSFHRKQQRRNSADFRPVGMFYRKVASLLCRNFFDHGNSAKAYPLLLLLWLAVNTLGFTWEALVTLREVSGSSRRRA
jgi:GT2 family glycosyltransferase